MADWKTLSSKIVYETPFFKVHEDKALNQNGRAVDYSYMELQNSSVFIVAVNDAGEILLQDHYRYTIKQRIAEIPAGYMEEGEEPLAAAKRELQEESGLVSDEWHSLGKLYQLVGTTKALVYGFLAKNVRKTGEATDTDEDIAGHRFVKLSDIETMITNGELVNGPVIAWLYAAKIAGI